MSRFCRRDVRLTGAALALAVASMLPSHADASGSSASATTNVENNSAVDTSQKKMSNDEFAQLVFGVVVSNSSGDGDGSSMDVKSDLDVDGPVSSGLFTSVGYTRTTYAKRTAINGETQRTDTSKLNIGYRADYGDWGFAVIGSAARSINNGIFSAFDNTTVGVTAGGGYHVLSQQIHGVALDVGPILGYSYSMSDRKNALAATPFNLGDYENVGSGQAGLYVRVAKMFSQGTLVSLGATSFYDIHFQNASALGRTAQMSSLDFNLVQYFGKAYLGGGVSGNRLAQLSLDHSMSYGDVSLKAGYVIDPRFSVGLSTSTTLGNSQWRSTGGVFSLNWKL